MGFESEGSAPMFLTMPQEHVVSATKGGGGSEVEAPNQRQYLQHRTNERMKLALGETLGGDGRMELPRGSTVVPFWF